MTSWVVALHTVLDTADPVTLCWAAVIRSVMLCPDIFCSLDAATNWDFTASSLLLYRYEPKKPPGNKTSTSAATVRNPPYLPASVEKAGCVRAAAAAAAEGGIKTVWHKQPGNVGLFLSYRGVKRGLDLGDALIAGSARWLIRPGCLSRFHPDVALRIPAFCCFLLLLLLLLPPLL